EKTKIMISGKINESEEQGDFPCGCCGKGVRENSIWCRGCQKWCHGRCSGLGRVKRDDENYRCPACIKGKIDVEKTIVIGSGKKNKKEEQSYPCGCCGKEVRKNAIWCRGCQKWCHGRCSGLGRVKKDDENYRCPACINGK
ncbi:unnamed protein product, partial [Meganyctiphanes norvegica]